MCSHGNTVTQNDVKVCLDCGLTLLPNGKTMFEKEITGYRPKKKKKKKKKKRRRKRGGKE